MSQDTKLTRSLVLVFSIYSNWYFDLGKRNIQAPSGSAIYRRSDTFSGGMAPGTLRKAGNAVLQTS